MSASDQQTWYLRVPEGQVYGPVDKATLDQWVQQGRADAQCYVGRSAQGPWEPIGRHYPHLGGSPAGSIPPMAGGVPGPMPPPQGQSVPGKVEAVRLMAIIGGALATLYGLGAAGTILLFGIASFGLGCLCLPLPLYLILAGVMALTQGIDAVKKPPRTAAIMQIICIIGGDVINLVLGIVELMYLNDPEVKAYYRARGIVY